MGLIYSRRIVSWPVFLAVGSLVVILAASPLFRTLGFEYSAISALLLSVACGFMAAAQAGQPIDSALPQVLRRSLVYAAIPLLVSFLSLPFLPNCAFGDGLKMYALVALPVASLASFFGTAIGALARSRKNAIVLFGLFWLLTFIVSLLPGYFFPQLFTYGWQYGYFPGLVWDESIELRNAYGWHLLEWGTLAIILLVIAAAVQGKPRNGAWWLKLGGLVVVYAVLLWNRGESGVTTTHAKVEDRLSSEIRVDSRTTIHYKASSLTNEEVELLRTNTLWYLHDIRSRLALTDTTQAISIYLYPSVESLYEMIGTRSASIAKPWMSELHIAKENVESLKHELVHVLLREWAGFPFHASWSTALTEGVAMSLEPSYDGLHTLHEHSCVILRMKLGTGVRNIMGFAGFASGASTTSYVLAGSFTNYLLDSYGPAKLKDVYSSLDFEEAYGKPLIELEKEWKVAIDTAMPQLTHFDTLRTRFYFDRQSILFIPCLRTLGKRNMEAREAMEEGRYSEAERLYSEIYRENGSINAFRSIVNSMLRRGEKARAKVTLDTATFSSHPQAPSLYILRGDLLGVQYYDTLLMTGLSSGSILSAFTRTYMPERERYLKDLYASNSILRSLPFEPDTMTLNSRQRIVTSYMIAELYREEGVLARAREYYDEAIGEADRIGEDNVITDLLKLRALAIEPLSTRPYSAYAQPGVRAEFDEFAKRKAFVEQLRDTDPAVK